VETNLLSHPAHSGVQHLPPYTNSDENLSRIGVSAKGRGVSGDDGIHVLNLSFSIFSLFCCLHGTNMPAGRMKESRMAKDLWLHAFFHSSPYLGSNIEGN